MIYTVVAAVAFCFSLSCLISVMAEGYMDKPKWWLRRYLTRVCEGSSHCSRLVRSITPKMV